MEIAFAYPVNVLLHKEPLVDKRIKLKKEEN